MEDYPATRLEFEARFATEESCRDYLFQLRWPDGFGARAVGIRKRGPSEACCSNVRSVPTRPP